MMYLAHFDENTHKFQSIKEHSEKTAALAQEFTIDALKDAAFIAGIFHDIGKYQASFQEKITANIAVKVEHATCGALALSEYYSKITALLIAYCVCGHHTGISDGGNFADSADDTTLSGRLKRHFEDYRQFKTELAIPQINEAALIKFLK